MRSLVGARVLINVRLSLTPTLTRHGRVTQFLDRTAARLCPQSYCRFDFLNCPLCKVPMHHWAIEGETAHWRKLQKTVEEMALARLVLLILTGGGHCNAAWMQHAHVDVCSGASWWRPATGRY